MLTAALLTFSVPATASGGTVSEHPVEYTPHVLDGDVQAFAVVGDTVVVGGDFTSVADAAQAHTYERWFLFAFSLSSGRVLPFQPFLDGPVLCLEAGPGNTVYVGGRFHGGLTQLDLDTGQPVAGFQASLDTGDVRAMAWTESGLYVGGAFSAINGTKRSGLARLDPVTGAVDGWDPKLKAPELGGVKVDALAATPRGDRLAVAGALTRVGGEYRVQLAMLDLTGATPRLADWWTDAYNKPCHAGFDTYIRGIAFSPDSSYLVIVSTGRMNAQDKLCDSAARFETYERGEQVPTWSNHTGSDSLYAVAISDSTVYVGGHQRWMNNPYGHDAPGPGAVSRPGLAAIDPDTGLATNWNPTRTRGVGVKAFALTNRGLLVGSDTDELAHEYHGRLGMFPR